jgi:hypothetical protein
MRAPGGVGGAEAAARAPVPLPFQVRTGPFRVNVPNQDPVCFLYDEAHAPAIVRAAPDVIVGGFSREAVAEDDGLRDLALRGALVAYELYRPEEIRIDLSIGRPITAGELRSGQWLRPQLAFLDLPTGRLRIDSAASLPFGKQARAFRGSVVTVPAGRYVLSLHRYDWYGRRMFSRFWDGPSEVIRLTPVGASRLNGRPKPMLLFPEAPVDAWEGQYEVSPGVFKGKLVGDVGALKSFAFNLDRDAARNMELQAGHYLDVSCGGHHYRGLYLGDMRIDQLLEQHGGYTVGELRAAAPFLAYMDHWQRPRRPEPSSVVVMSGGPTASHDFSGLREGDEVTVTIDRERIEPLRWRN